MTSVPPPRALDEELAPPGAPAPGPSPGPLAHPGAEPEWRLWTAPAAVALGFALGSFGYFLVAILGQRGGTSLSHPTPVVSIVGNAVFDLGFVASALYFAALHGRPRPADFGYRRVRLRLIATAVLVAGAAYYTLSALYVTVLSIHGKDKALNQLGANKSTAALVAAGVFVTVLAPIAEEFFFRGFLFGTLRRWRGPWVAAVITGILFGLAHTGSASSPYLIELAFLGFVLCLVRWRTRSLYPCMALHSLNNSLALGVTEHWSVPEIVACVAVAIVVIATLTGPLAARPAAVVAS